MVVCTFPRWSSKHLYLFALDALFNAFVVTPLSIALWWSIWDLFYDLAYAIHTDSFPQLGFVILLVCGTMGELIILLIQFCIRPYLSPDRRSKVYLAVVVRVEMYVTFLFSMAVWVGGWTLLDELTGYNGISTMVCLVISLPGLLVLRGLSSAVSAPMNMWRDSDQKPFDHPTRFMVDPQTSSGHGKLLLYASDCMITVIVIDYLLIAYWRAGFNILDLYFLPQDPELSAWITVIAGYLMYFGLLFLQFPAVHISKKLSSPWKRRLWKATYWFLAFVMMTCIWRGLWNAIVLYAALDNLSKPYYYLVPLIAHICIVAIMLALDIFINGTTGFAEVDDAWLDGRDLLIKNYFSSVKDLMTAYAIDDETEDFYESTALITSGSQKTPVI